MQNSLVYIHIGQTLPRYIYDSIYQSILMCNKNIYILVNECHITEMKVVCSTFNTECYLKEKFDITDLNFISLESLDNIKITQYKIPQEYRNSFWEHTTTRFFYIEQFMKIHNISNVIHIENDVMLYESLKNLIFHKLCVVKDSEFRVIPSIMFIPNSVSIEHLNNYILKYIKKNTEFTNDMMLLGGYCNTHPDNVVFLPHCFIEDVYQKYLFDGAGIGQYLGGIDPRNIKTSDTSVSTSIIEFMNPTIGFVNETCDVKYNTITFIKKSVISSDHNIPIMLYYAINENNIVVPIINLHIHSKQLSNFSSIDSLEFCDLISGDSVLTLCDFIITTRQVLNFHKNIEKFISADNIIIVNNFESVNTKLLNEYFASTKKQVVTLFLYTHLLKLFVRYILPYIEMKCIIYLHNSDDNFDDNECISKLLQSKIIVRIYSQNINCNNHKKFNLLPIGIANSMWIHGNKIELYNTMRCTYYKKKTKNLYININPNTYPYRVNLLQEFEKRPNDFSVVKTPVPYLQYLENLSEYRFCFAIRGNGIDTHRFWEALYLGVIPVIVNNKYTNMNNFVLYLRKLDIPFYEIKDDTMDKYTDSFFNENLYKQLIKNCDSSIYNLQQFKLKYYSPKSLSLFNEA